MSGSDTGTETPMQGAAAGASPPVSPSAAEELAGRYYGLGVRAIRVAGERDDNFRLENENGAAGFLKIAHARESPDVTNLATAVLMHLAEVAPDLPVQRVLPTLSGDPELKVAVDGGPVRTARLTTYLEGTLLRQVPLDAALRRDLGGTLGRLNRALRGFDHPGLSYRHLLWDVNRPDAVRQLLDPGSADQRELVRQLDRFEAEVEPRLSGLRSQPVHNDFSRDNTVIDSVTRRVAGIIDFGDLTVAPVVNDVAIAASQLWDPDDPFETAADVVFGYTRVDPLTEDEFELFHDLVVARIVWRLIISEWRAKRFPENRDYILRNTARAWDELEMMLATDPEVLNARMAEAGENGKETPVATD